MILLEHEASSTFSGNTRMSSVDRLTTWIAYDARDNELARESRQVVALARSLEAQLRAVAVDPERFRERAEELRLEALIIRNRRERIERDRARLRLERKVFQTGAK
jgi:hypothetical protein